MSATGLAFDPRCGSGRLPRPAAAALRVPPAWKTGAAAPMRGGSAAPSRRCSRLPTPGADVERRGRAGPGRAFLVSKSGERRPGWARACGRDRSETGGARPRRAARADRPGARLCRAAAAADSRPATAARRGTPAWRNAPRQQRRRDRRAVSTFSAAATPGHPWLRLGGVGRRRAGACGGAAGGDKLAGRMAVRGGVEGPEGRTTKSHGVKVLLTVLSKIAWCEGAVNCNERISTE